jgi:hypothetical protein
MIGLGVLGCDVKVDTTDLATELRPAEGQPVERTTSHASCGGTDVYLEYTNAAGEPVARCFGLKEDTQVCALAKCETTSDLSDEELRRMRDERARRQKAKKL